MDKLAVVSAPVRNLREYKAWTAMKQRCLNRNCKHYEYYGGRGIKVCDEWVNNFQQFIADVGMRPSPLHSLDRIDNNDDYRPGNVRWATKSEQMANRRSYSSSGNKYVYKSRVGTWYASVDGAYLGSYKNIEDAQKVVGAYLDGVS